MPISRLRRLRALLRRTASHESMDRLNHIPLRPDDARPRPTPAMVAEPDQSRFQRHSAHLRRRIVDSRIIESDPDDVPEGEAPVDRSSENGDDQEPSPAPTDAEEDA